MGLLSVFGDGDLLDEGDVVDVGARGGNIPPPLVEGDPDLDVEGVVLLLV